VYHEKGRHKLAVKTSLAGFSDAKNQLRDSNGGNASMECHHDMTRWTSFDASSTLPLETRLI
jgi:hypothetical protein